MRRAGPSSVSRLYWLAALAFASCLGAPCVGAPTSLDLMAWRRCESLGAEDFRAKRITAIRLHERHLWIGTEKGVAWTRDEGETWNWVDLTGVGLAPAPKGKAGLSAKRVAKAGLALRRNTVTAIDFDGEDVWVGTLNGLCVGRDLGKSWCAYGRPHGLGEAIVTAVAARGGTVWVATSEGLFVSRDRGGAWGEAKTALPLAPGGTPGFPRGLRGIEFGEGASGPALWLSGFDSVGPWDLVHSEDGGTTWKAVSTGMTETKTGRVRNYVHAARILGRQVWACARLGLGVSSDFGRRWRTLTTQDGLPSNNVHAITRRGRSCWVGTADGLCHQAQDAGAWRAVEGFHAPVLGVAATRSGVWMRTRGGLVKRSYAGAWSALGRRSEVLAVAVADDRYQSRWAVGAPGGLCVSRDRGRTWRVFTVADGLPGNVVSALSVDGRGDLWAATDGGVALLKRGASRVRGFTLRDGLHSNRIHDIAADDKVVWAATSRGLARYELSRPGWRCFQTELAWLRVALADPYVYGATADWAGKRPDQVKPPSRLGKSRRGETFLVRGWLRPIMGEQWDHLRITNHDGGPINQLAARGELVWAATGDGLFRSRDRGRTWARYADESLWGGVVAQVFPVGHDGWGAFSTPRGFASRFGTVTVTRDLGRRWDSLTDRPMGDATTVRADRGDLLCGARNGLWVREGFLEALRPGRPGRLGWLRLAYMAQADARPDHLGYVSSVDRYGIHGASVWLGSLGAGVIERGFVVHDEGVRVPGIRVRYASWQPYRTNRAVRRGPVDLAGNSIYAIRGGPRYVWFGAGAGLSAFDRLSRWRSWYPKSGQPLTAPVTSVAVHKGQAWAGGPKGLAALDLKTGEWRRPKLPEDWPSQRIPVILSAGGSLWVCTDKGGMRLTAEGRWRPFLPGVRIYDAQAGRSRVYFGSDTGIYGVDMGGQVREHRTQANSPLTSDHVFRVLPIGRDLWALTASGMHLILRDRGEAQPSPEARSSSRRADGVVVVVNDNSKGSLEVGAHYVRRRGIPAGNVCHVRCPTAEEVSRKSFENTIRVPLWRFLMEKGLSRKTSFIVTTYGIPLKITAETRARDRLETDRACVDSELCVLGRKHVLQGPLVNPYLYRGEPFNSGRFGMYLVTRLDGPTPAVAKGLVDMAIQAERARSFSGRGFAYLDLDPDENLRGAFIDEAIRPNYDLMRREQRLRRRLRLNEEAREFDRPNECPAAFFYMGWYSNVYWKRTFTWLPGAVGVHIHSLSARSLRRPKTCWLGGAVADGLTAGMGAVYEPSVLAVNTVENLYRYLHSGYTWAETAYMSTRFVSWQNVVVGDPLYQPLR